MKVIWSRCTAESNGKLKISSSCRLKWFSPELNHPTKFQIIIKSMLIDVFVSLTSRFSLFNSFFFRFRASAISKDCLIKLIFVISHQTSHKSISALSQPFFGIFFPCSRLTDGLIICVNYNRYNNTVNKCDNLFYTSGVGRILRGDERSRKRRIKKKLQKLDLKMSDFIISD